MNFLRTMRGRLSHWLNDVAEAVIAVIDQISAPRSVRLVETDAGQFTIKTADAESPLGRLGFKDGRFVSDDAKAEAALRGSLVELELQPGRFLFKPLELPSAAATFLDGVVRAQIDRLTPWLPQDAAFGTSKPADAAAGRIVVTVAATAKAILLPYVQALRPLGVRSVIVTTPLPDVPNAGTVQVFEENTLGLRDVPRTRRILVFALTATFLIALASMVASSIIGDRLQTRQDELASRIAARRSAALAARSNTADPTTLAERALAMRKNESPASVLVLETLSEILPDHTYVTELRIEGDTLRITGFTRDAPSLIRLIEQSRRFTHATFFAPTTRAPSDPGDRFNIEAHILPVSAARS